MHACIILAYMACMNGEKADRQEKIVHGVHQPACAAVALQQKQKKRAQEGEVGGYAARYVATRGRKVFRLFTPCWQPHAAATPYAMLPPYALAAGKGALERSGRHSRNGVRARWEGARLVVAVLGNTADYPSA